MSIRFEERDDPMLLVARIFGDAQVDTVHQMGLAIEGEYEKSRAVDLDVFMNDQRWTNGQKVTSMISLMSAAISELDKRGGTRQSFIIAMVAHIWAMVDTMEDKKAFDDQTEKAYFLFPSSERATVFAEKAMDFLDDKSERLEALSVGPFVRVTCRLLQSNALRHDLTQAARAMGGDPVPHTAWKGRI